MSSITFYLITACMGLVGVGLLAMTANAPVTRAVYTFALLVLNYFAVLGLLFMAYTITGFDDHGEWGMGWLDWPHIVGGVTALYLPMLVGGVVRLLGDRRR